MAVVSSFGALTRMESARTTWAYSSAGSVNLYGSCETYGKIYRTQPSVRTCVDFLARNIAQLGLPIYRVVSDTDRARLRDHELASWLKAPNPGTTRYRLFEGLVQDLAIYFNAYWLKVRLADRIGLVRLPPEDITVEGSLMPTLFVWTHDGKRSEFLPSEIVHFSGYDGGISPLETLRRVLAEEKSASEHRQYFWNNASRKEGIITQHPTGPNYTPDQIKAYRAERQDRHAGAKNAGLSEILPKGMEYHEASFSSKDSEYVASRKLNREEVAAAYHIPLPMVGILDHATFSNIREQHKHLYQDCLGPWLVMIEEEIERQLLTECADQQGVYVEFNIAEKLKGSFEEQAAALQTLVGRPVMTLDEGRARLNLPSMGTEDAKTVVLPMNMDGRGQRRLPADGVPGDDDE